MLYNLYVHKNNYGRDRMTKIFEQFISSTNSSFAKNNILNDYFRIVGNRDYDRSDDGEDYSIEDFLISIAPLVDKNARNDSKYPIVKYISEDGRIVYHNTRKNQE